MKIQTNFSQYPELRIDEQQVKNCIRKHFGTIKAPIYVYIDSKLKKTLKKSKLTTRDPRKVERKKYGQPGARKRFQFSKR